MPILLGEVLVSTVSLVLFCIILGNAIASYWYGDVDVKIGLWIHFGCLVVISLMMGVFPYKILLIDLIGIAYGLIKLYVFTKNGKVFDGIDVARSMLSMIITLPIDLFNLAVYGVTKLATKRNNT